MLNEHLLKSINWIAGQLVFVSLIFCIGLSQGIYFGSWSLAVLILILLVGLLCRDKFGIFFGILLSWYLAQCLWTYEIIAGGMNIYDRLAFKEVSSARGFHILLMVAVLGLVKVRHRESIGTGLKIFVLVGAYWSLWQWMRGLAPTGLLSNISMNMCFLACFWPFFPWKHPGTWIIPVVVVLSGSSMGVGVFLITTIGVLAKRYNWWGVLKWTTGLCVLSLLAYFYFSPWNLEPTDTNGRWNLWVEVIQWGKQYMTPAQVLFGSGVNTSRIYLPHIQHSQTPWVTDFYIYFHNDWFQILFENGAIFLTGCLIYYFTLLRKAVQYSSAIFGALLGYGAMMLGNFPLEIPIHAFMGLFIVTEITRKGTENAIKKR